MATGNSIILSLGSNFHPEQNLFRACRALEAWLPGIRFSAAVYTEPVGWITPDLFLNCVAVATTGKQPAELCAAFKALEAEAGRTPEGKARGIIPLDIDLLAWNGTVLKPADWERAYVREALASLEED